jgi:hypothetical protein
MRFLLFRSQNANGSFIRLGHDSYR